MPPVLQVMPNFWRAVYVLTRGLFLTLKTRIFACHPRVSLARVTYSWWRHNRLAMTSQWPDNCDANTWQVISNSFDIDFIHGDIHGRSCIISRFQLNSCPTANLVDVYGQDMRDSRELDLTEQSAAVNWIQRMCPSMYLDLQRSLRALITSMVSCEV